MHKGQQAWIGIGFGVFVLVAVFYAAFALTGGSGIAVDGDGLESAADGGEAGDSLGEMTTSGDGGEVRAFGSDATGSVDGEADAGLALRVVTDADSDGSDSESDSDDTTSTSSSSTTATTAPSSSTTVASTASSTTAAPTTDSSTTTTATTAEETTTTKASSSSSSTSTADTEPTTTTRPATTAPSSPEARTFEQEVIRLTNEERAAGGCGPLSNNGKLHAAALGHSIDMAENNYFDHDSLDGSTMRDRVERQGYSWRRLAENIAAGYRTPAAVVEGWMNSSDHRRNIMNCDLTEIGVGFHDFYWTQNFATPA